MLPGTHQDRWRKMLSMRTTAAPSFSAESFDEQLSPTRYQNSQQQFHFNIGSSNSLGYSMLNGTENAVFSSDMVGYLDRKQLAEQLRLQQEYQKHYASQRTFSQLPGGYLTPAATESISRCTLTSEFSHPSSQDEYEQLIRGALLSNDMETRVSRTSSESKKLIFPAESVHNLVKSLRDTNKLREVSNKVFVGGINHTMDRKTIDNFFYEFGEAFIDWPVKTPKANARGKQLPASSYSYLFLVYSHEESVKNLIKKCQKPAYNEFYVNLPGCQDMIQIRPWFLENAFYVHEDAKNRKVIDIHRTVFVGGLPRIVTALEIAHLFSEFGKVLLVTIDIDQDYGYPKGAARVTFEKDSSLSMALDKQYLKFDNIDSSKSTIEIKPYVMEDVGCDQCGGLWFNPFVDIMTHLELSWTQRKTPTRSENNYDVWSSFGESTINAASHNADHFHNFDNQRMDFGSVGSEKKIDNRSSFQSNTPSPDQDQKELYNGAQQFLEAAKCFNLHTPKTVCLDNMEIPIGPDLWGCFVPQPQMGLAGSASSFQLEQQVQSHLKMKAGNVYSNKSSYCKDKPCRQYYCASCAHKLHSRPGMNQHVLLPAGKPERRPRKDKDMYLVRKQF